ncbi:restriction endonuclease, partial [Lactobacillus murinus]
YYFKEAITWPLITSGGLSVRYREYGSIHDVSGMSAFSDNVDVIYYIIGMLNTPLGNNILRILNPTINSQIGDFRNIPVIVNQKYEIINFVQQAILLTKEDWDLNENTWNFKISPLI